MPRKQNTKSAGTGRRRTTTQAKRKSGTGQPGWLWLLTGAAVAGFAVLIFNLHQQRGEPPAEPPADDETPVAQPEPEPEPEPQRRFRFRELLLEDEVTVPEEALPPRQREDSAATQPAPTVEEGYDYVLQAGSFRSYDDADGLRAALTLLGFDTMIHTVELDDGGQWHRVRVGPFSDTEDLQRAHSRLEENNIQPLLLQQRG